MFITRMVTSCGPDKRVYRICEVIINRLVFSLTSRIRSSNDGAKNISSPLVPPQKLVPPMKDGIFSTTMPWSSGNGILCPSHSSWTRWPRCLENKHIFHTTLKSWEMYNSEFKEVRSVAEDQIPRPQKSVFSNSYHGRPLLILVAINKLLVSWRSPYVHN